MMFGAAVQAFLSLAFLSEAMLMGLHRKDAPMDVLIHVMLTCSMLSCFICTACEAAWRSSPLLTMGRIVSMYLQGALFIAAAHTMYESKTSLLSPEGVGQISIG